MRYSLTPPPQGLVLDAVYFAASAPADSLPFNPLLPVWFRWVAIPPPTLSPTIVPSRALVPSNTQLIISDDSAA